MEASCLKKTMPKTRPANKSIKKPKTNAPVDTASIARDAFQNFFARTGFGTPSLMEGTAYPLTRLTRNYNLMNSLYRSHWIVRKIIDTIPQDALKNWVELVCEVDPKKMDRFHRQERRTGVRSKFIQAAKWGRLYGGAAAVMMLEGQEDILDEPLDHDSIMPGSFKGLLVLDRWSGITPSADFVEDINDPDFSLPLHYRVTTVDGQFYDVHSSRVLRFIGRDLPNWEKQAEVGWGASEIEIIYEELKKRDNSSWNIASLIFIANLRVFKMGDLGQLLSSGNAASTQRVYQTVQALNHLMSNQGIQVIGKDDDFDTKSFTFTGLNEIYQSFMLDLAGASGIPMTKLFGRSPAGMNATGESDEDNYESLLSEVQDGEYRPQLEKLFPVMCLSEWGEIPEDFDFRFNPYKTLNGKERAELAKAKVDAIVAARNTDLISQKTGMQELQMLEDETGMFSNITDEDIEAADDSIEDRSEMQGFGSKPGFKSSQQGMNGNED
jgi:phage-related protein (TIGR01555 family)